MTSVTENAYAKLNISLDVTGKRPDGFHDMLMVMQTISLCDEVTVTLCDGESFAETNLHFIPGDERNLAVKAASAFFKASGMDGVGAHIKLFKNIPVGAGMAGGSSDAAAVIRALNRLTGEKMSPRELEAIAAGVGSDVAFCISGGTCLASGRGEELKRLPMMPDCGIVVTKPEFSISTPELFKKLDSVKLRCHPDTDGLCEAIKRGDLLGVSRRMYNVFEDVPDRRMKTIASIKSRILDTGALGSVMTGTGSAVFGVFESEKAAGDAVFELAPEFDCCRLARPQPAIFDADN